jgi:hypothetical protein
MSMSILQQLNAPPAFKCQGQTSCVFLLCCAIAFFLLLQGLHCCIPRVTIHPAQIALPSRGKLRSLSAVRLFVPREQIVCRQEDNDAKNRDPVFGTEVLESNHFEYPLPDGFAVKRLLLTEVYGSLSLVTSQWRVLLSRHMSFLTEIVRAACFEDVVFEEMV